MSSNNTILTQIPVIQPIIDALAAQNPPSECDSLLANEPYDLPIHIGAIFILLVTGLIATMIPVLAAWAPKRFRVNEFVFTLLRTFGIGVILATGFVHMFPPADQALTNKCLPEFFTEEYTSFAGLIAMASVLMVQLIQTIAVNHFKIHSASDHSHSHSHNAIVEHSSTDDSGLQRTLVGPSSITDTAQQQTSNLDLEKAESNNGKLNNLPENIELGAVKVASEMHSDCCGHEQIILQTAHEHHHLKITTIILEFGIALHSIIIGVALGVARGPEFKSLFIALAFHQFFEGVALSTTAIKAGFKSKKLPLLLACLYALTTPIGISIGVAVSGSFNENSQTSLLVQGIFDAISAGILIYDAMVNLMTTSITHSSEFARLSGLRKCLVFISLWLGAGVMALLGRWA